MLCWGNNDVGQLGDGLAEHERCTADGQAFDCARRPVGVASIGDAAAVSADAVSTCILRTNGRVVCWGSNASGKLGDGTMIDRNVPTAVVGLEEVVDVSVGEFHACAVRRDGSVWCWGNGRGSALGTGDLTSETCDHTRCSSRPLRVAGIDDAVSVSAGLHVACARRQSGAAVCWGANDYGLVGDGTAKDRDGAVAVAGISDVAIVYAGYLESCAASTKGDAWCWGVAGGRRAGFVPTPVPGLPSPVVALAGGWYHTCALLADGHVRCWGKNQFGQLGDGTLTDHVDPRPPLGL